MMLAQILLRCTCLISFAFPSLPVHCVSLLTPASFGFQHERKSSKGSVLSPISALSLGTNSPTLYVMLKHNPSSKLNQKPHYSAQCTNQTRRTSLCIQLLTLLFPPVKLHVICTCVSARRERERERERGGANEAPMV